MSCLVVQALASLPEATASVVPNLRELLHCCGDCIMKYLVLRGALSRT